MVESDNEQEQDHEQQFRESQDEVSSNDEENNESEDEMGMKGDLNTISQGSIACESSSVNTKESATGEFSVDKIELNLGTTQNAREKRKERNKLLARKSRQRMKTELESLKSQLVVLMKENEKLKQEMNSIQTPAVDVKLLIQNDIQLPDNIAQLIKQLMSKTEKTITPRKMKRSSFCIANAISVDVPIVYASPGFLKLTGYDMAEILGRNCRFLQGPKTDLREVQRMKDAINEGRDITVVLLNYRKDGKTFWNQIQLAHLKDQSGKTFLIVGIQTKVKPSLNQQPPTISSAEDVLNEVLNEGDSYCGDKASQISPYSSQIQSLGTSASTTPNQTLTGGGGIPNSSSVLLYPDMQYYRPADSLPGPTFLPPPRSAPGPSLYSNSTPNMMYPPHLANSLAMHPLNFPMPAGMNQFMQPVPRNYPLEYLSYPPTHPLPPSSSMAISPPTSGGMLYPPTILSAINSLNRSSARPMMTHPPMSSFIAPSKPTSSSAATNFPPNFPEFSPIYYELPMTKIAINSQGHTYPEPLLRPTPLLILQVKSIPSSTLPNPITRIRSSNTPITFLEVFQGLVSYVPCLLSC